MGEKKGLRAPNSRAVSDCCSCCCFMPPPIRSRWAPPSAAAFFLVALVASALVAVVFFWLFTSSFRRPEAALVGCHPDSEGSWSVGVYYGKSPFSLSPIELHGISSANSSAWPIANPVLTCASPSSAGYPSNFVADPFLFVQDSVMYLFFESKSATTMKGDIGVARSFDLGGTWQFLGIALEEEWHLSYPFVFSYQNQIYMMPEGNKKGELRLYRAADFPLKWTLEKVLIKKPLIDASLIQYEGNYWLFASDFNRFGVEKNAELEIWYSNSPLGPWKQHPRNPIYRADKSLGARNGGRPFIYEGSLYRLGQDCGGTYGRRVRLYKVEKLNKEEFNEVPVNLGIKEPKKGRNAWNGMRYHHLDTQQLPSGNWIAVMDGDRVPSGDTTTRFVLGCTFILLLFLLVVFMAFLVGAVNCCVALNRRNESSWFKTRPHINFKARRCLAGMNRYGSSIRARLNPKTCSGKFVLSFLSVVGIAFVCMSVQLVFGGNGAEEAYLVGGQYSQFTMITMTYEARLWNLKLYVKHYSRCESVREIVVVWNKGKPPSEDEFDSAVPVRIRVEKHNSLNNRFKVDPLIKTRAVLELDDDIMMTCNDIEKGFRVWRENPDRLVGFYPRLIDGSPLQYRNERYARGKNGYNVILTGAAFMDCEYAFKKYWSEEASEGRDFVDKSFNCEDLLMNFLYSNSSFERTVEYVHPAWAIDTSKFSTAAISRNTQVHYDIRTNCLSKFSALYGHLPSRWEFAKRLDSWDR
ncbi:glycosyltransferase family protein 64 [Canna indica]|uniref:Glucosamine inositolphosphorylceramide transferase 1 n=1 Tax=Canna indica TaxID=4628 RepID=A0AAQ3Q8E6_9LILI|nr:glycosyltransferase family protein 64 [Canna indica]